MKEVQFSKVIKRIQQINQSVKEIGIKCSRQSQIGFKSGLGCREYPTNMGKAQKGSKQRFQGIKNIYLKEM